MPGCLESVRWPDDIHVFDSGSTGASQEDVASIGRFAVKQQCVDQGSTD
jgi:hypothetical protein